MNGVGFRIRWMVIGFFSGGPGRVYSTSYNCRLYIIYQRSDF